MPAEAPQPAPTGRRPTPPPPPVDDQADLHALLDRLLHDHGGVASSDSSFIPHPSSLPIAGGQGRSTDAVLFSAAVFAICLLGGVIVLISSLILHPSSFLLESSPW